MARNTPNEANQAKGAAARDSRFVPLFKEWAARVRGRLAMRHALTGAAIGLAVATVPAAVAWKTRHGALRPYAPLVGVLGAAAGLAVARRKRWSDTDARRRRSASVVRRGARVSSSRFKRSRRSGSPGSFFCCGRRFRRFR
jgi:hypothetical protein